ncbi:HepT-like ribonuclease domain-containing protein [Candidatus Poribacteria bacterium]
MRNHLIHAYDEIDVDILWDTIINDIPQLIAELEKLPVLR